MIRIPIFIVIGILICINAKSQCNNTSQWPTIDVSAIEYSDSVQIANNNYAGDFASIINIKPGGTYIFYSEVPSDYITVRSVDQSEVLAYAKTPVEVTFDNTVEAVNIHLNADAMCGEDAQFRTTGFYCSSCPGEPYKVGIETNDPKAVLDVGGDIRIGESILPPQSGSIRYNEASQDFEGYDGEKWISFTKPNGNWGEIVAPALQANGNIVPEFETPPIGYGYALGMSEEYAIVGTKFNNVIQSVGSGSAHIMKYENDEWVVAQVLTAFDSSIQDYFGFAVAISGDVAIVSAPDGNLISSEDIGAVYVYERSGNEWVFQQKITGFDSVVGDGFGRAIALEGNTIAVGSAFCDIGGASEAGAIYIYENDGNSWVLDAKLTEVIPVVGARFGQSLDMDGGTIVVSNGDAAVTIISKSSNIWQIDQKIQITNSGLFFNHNDLDLAIDGDVVVVGSPNTDFFGGFDEGSVLIYKLSNSNGSWIFVEQFTSIESEESLNFGSAVDIQGNNVVIGTGSGFSESAELIVLNSEKKVATRTIIKALPSSPTGGSFGSTVGLNGTSILVGASDEKVNGSQLHGNVYYFKKNE